MRRTMMTAALALWAGAGLSGAAWAGPAPTVPAWISSTSFKPAKPRADDVMAYDAQSVRQDIRVQTRTSRVTLRLTNELGTDPVTIDQVELRAIAADGSLGAPHLARFGGAPGVTIGPGAAFYTDPVDFPLPAFGDVAVTVHYPAHAEPVAHRAMVRIASGLETPGHETAPARGAAIVSAVETAAPAAACRHVIVALGDSITEGAGSTAHNDWPSQLARRLVGPRCDVIVVNAGISGNRVLAHNGTPGMLTRLDRDVLSVPGLTDIVFVEGINDVRAVETKGVDPEAFAAEMIEGYRQLVARAHAHGVRVIGSPILPYKGTGNQNEVGLAIVDRINTAVRAGGIFDVVVDFNRAVADPADPQRMRADWHKGDWLHPNDTGYTAMAAAVPASLFQPAKR